MCYRVQQGESMQQAMKVAGFIPQARQALFPLAIKRLYSADWSHILQQSFIIESMSKGQGEIRVRDQALIWDKILDTAVELAGKKLV
jgi:DNA polymerase III delta subunit